MLLKLFKLFLDKLKWQSCKHQCFLFCTQFMWEAKLFKSPDYRVTLKIRSRRTQRNTEMPRGGMISSSTRTVSRIPPHTTKQSKRLKNATKYPCNPRLYIFSNISTVNNDRRTLLAMSMRETQKEREADKQMWSQLNHFSTCRSIIGNTMTRQKKKLLIEVYK